MSELLLTVAAQARAVRAAHPHLTTAVALRDQLLRDYPELADRVPAVLHNACRCALLPPRGQPAPPPPHNLTPAQITHLLSLLPNGSFDEAAEQPEEVYPAPYVGGNPENVLVIPDLHAPFMREGFLLWCREQQEKYNCGTVVAIGDIADGASWNFHEHNPDGMSVGAELTAAKKQLAQLFAMFPTAKCCLGNHDLLIARKAKAIGLSAKFIRPFGEIFGAPATWEFGYEFELYGVVYTHGGAGGNAIRMATHARRSYVQGHLHAQSICQWLVSATSAIFGLQVGAGINDKAYAFEYGLPYPKKSAIGCGVVLEAGRVPMNLLMPL